MAQGMELLDNGTKVFTGPGAAFGTDALLLARFAMPRRKETALDLCSGCGIVALAWHDAGHRGPCTAVELDADASALCRRAVQETPGAEHITALCTDLRTFCKSGPEQGKYDFAACNPPYFTGGYVSPDARRATARHDGSCTMQDVAACAARALHDGGKLAAHRKAAMYGGGRNATPQGHKRGVQRTQSGGNVGIAGIVKAPYRGVKMANKA